MVKQILKESEERMHKAVEIVRQELVKIPTGKATTALLEGIKVEYYGSIMPLQQVANIAVVDLHLLSITPWDKSAMDAIQKAVQTANIGMNAGKDVEHIRVPIPPLNEERRRELVKLTKKFGEEGKIAIRNVRR